MKPAENDVPETGEAVDVFLAVGIHEHRAVATHPDTAGSVNSGIVLRMDERGQVAGDEVVQSEVIVCMVCTLLRSTRAGPLIVLKEEPMILSTPSTVTTL
jgi:hypothetical protein